MPHTDDALLQQFDGLLEKELDSSIRTLLEEIRSEYARSLKRMDRILHVSDRNERKILHFNEMLETRVQEELEKRLAAEKEKKAQEELLIQQSKMAAMGEMIAAIAHQWRQPLNTMMILSQGLPVMYQYDELDQKTIQHEVDKICEQIRFMDQTIDDFRDFFKPSKERLTFDMAQAVDSIYSILHPQMSKLHIHVTINADKDVRAFGYPNEFKQVVLNLMNNARDILVEKGIKEKHITIRIYEENGEAVVTVLDNGGGIPEDLLPDRLFEPYISTKGDKGTGIGLSMSRTMIEENMKGSMRVSNREQGAEFKISLPTSSH